MQWISIGWASDVQLACVGLHFTWHILVAAVVCQVQLAQLEKTPASAARAANVEGFELPAPGWLRDEDHVPILWTPRTPRKGFGVLLIYLLKCLPPSAQASPPQGLPKNKKVTQLTGAGTVSTSTHSP